jgi:hypothetical protein
MSGSAKRRASDADRHIDESGETPSAKAYAQPLVRDDVRVRFDLSRGRLSVDGQAKVSKGIHDAVNYAVVCGLALLAAVVAVALCIVRHASGGTTFMIAAAVFVLIFAIGLIRTSTKQTRRD